MIYFAGVKSVCMFWYNQVYMKILALMFIGVTHTDVYQLLLSQIEVFC